MSQMREGFACFLSVCWLAMAILLSHLVSAEVGPAPAGAHCVGVNDDQQLGLSGQ